ncbi:uncharacterized protein J4E92_001628 [Alternaria infectoria]|uniref:uncharacterized protein n=1 Tax=Alternaria infectoria TaxID=45303 RepID=UPI00221F0CCD|nr:uncharacterized protein J4E92_001628 [Alternaria infectoria]KAI4936903.1 hypothetical protein J4E92_001628 [Alternaria infectoria]
MATQTENSTYMTPSTAPKLAGMGGPVKPTLLAFHGSGSNATVHTIQLARLMRVIKDHFEVESLEAPFPSQPGPGILPFFEGCGPFKRWMQSSVTISDMKAGNSTTTMPSEVEDLVRSTVERITSSGGKVVGLIGFSQGTKVVAGLLKGCEIRRALAEKGNDVSRLAYLDFEFGLSVCGSYPPPLIPPSASAALDAAVSSFRMSVEERKELVEGKISLPAFHVQGLQDEWNWAGQGLIDGWYEVGEGKSVVRHWEQGHLYPVQPEESQEIGEWIFGVLGRGAGKVGSEAR